MQSVCGLRSDSIQKKLLTVEGITFKKAMELMQSYKAAEKNAQQLKGTNTAVHEVVSHKRPTANRDMRACHRCGFINHTSDK